MDEKKAEEVELNLFYLHYRDAQKFHELATEDKTKLKSFYARHSILAIIFAFEALINKIYSEYYTPDQELSIIEKLSTREKWLLAPLVCAIENPTRTRQIGTFGKSREPFQSFSELLTIRNWLVHPKTGYFIPAIKTPWTISILESDKEVPWIETRKGTLWPQTRIPKNPFEITEKHSQTALDCFQNMFDELVRLFDGVFTQDWVWEIKLKQPNGNVETISIDSLWSGYTPEPEEINNSKRHGN